MTPSSQPPSAESNPNRGISARSEAYSGSGAVKHFVGEEHQSSLSSLTGRLVTAPRVWLFLDYDGTLADFAPTPDHVHPDPELIGLLTGLASQPSVRVTVISGRRLDHVRKLVPVPGVVLAGTYGVELQTKDRNVVERVSYDAIRPTLERLKAQWEDLLAGREGFYLEDKGWALALHGSQAEDNECERVLTEARAVAKDVIQDESEAQHSREYRLLGGHKFLELGPLEAHKGRTLHYLLARYPWPGALLVYVGDDDKDEEAFHVIQELGGVAVVVASESRETEADYRLPSPQATRTWLGTLLVGLDGGQSAM